MAWLRSLRDQVPGIGAANYYANSLTATGSSVASGAVRVPNGTANLQPTASRGRIRIKITGAGGAITSVTGTDGTNTVNLLGSVTFPATGDSERLFEFMTDLYLTSITANTTGGTATDVELVYAVG
jgi:hypothetical protein